jgi:hypothetical protein
LQDLVEGVFIGTVDCAITVPISMTADRPTAWFGLAATAVTMSAVTSIIFASLVFFVPAIDAVRRLLVFITGHRLDSAAETGPTW